MNLTHTLMCLIVGEKVIKRSRSGLKIMENVGVVKKFSRWIFQNCSSCTEVHRKLRQFGLNFFKILGNLGTDTLVNFCPVGQRFMSYETGTFWDFRDFTSSG